jgi:hypothetical protein
MRSLAAPALVLLLLVAAPVAAQTDDLGSEAQTEGYGRLFGYVCSVGGALIVLIGGVHIIKGMIAEAARGKKIGHMPETMLDDAPKKRPKGLYLGEKVPDWKIANRRAATADALKFLARKDDWFEEKYLARVAQKACRAIQAALEGRQAKKIERVVTEKCLEELQSEIKRLRKKGDKHVFGPVDITDVLVVQFDAPAATEKHSFTALITALSKDYYQDEKTGEVLKGDKKVYTYQEFWTFRRSKERWLVDVIRSSSDMDTILAAKNVLSQADLAAFTKKADPEHLREFVAR